MACFLDPAVGIVGGFFNVAGDYITGDEMLVWPILNPLESPIPIELIGIFEAAFPEPEVI